MTTNAKSAARLEYPAGPSARLPAAWNAKFAIDAQAAAARRSAGPGIRLGRKRTTRAPQRDDARRRATDSSEPPPTKASPTKTSAMIAAPVRGKDPPPLLALTVILDETVRAAPLASVPVSSIVWPPAAVFDGIVAVACTVPD